MWFHVPGEAPKRAREEMSAILGLSPTSTAWALVGMYLGHFANLEQAIDRTMVSVFGMGVVPFVALNRNLDLRAKVNVLRSMGQMVYGHPQKSDDVKPELADRFAATDKMLKTLIRPHIEERNMVAHSIFAYSNQDGPGVLFRVIKATSRLEIEAEFWSADTFLQKVDEFESLVFGLQRYCEDAEKYGFHKLSRARSIAELFG